LPRPAKRCGSPDKSSDKPRKSLGSGSVQERLNAAIQKKAVEAAVVELDVILMMLEKAFMANLQCGETPEA